MARPRTNSSPELSAGQSSYVLRRLISERRLSPGEVNRYLGDMRQEITDLERKLDELRAAIGGPSSSSRPASQAASSVPARRGRPGRPPGRPRRQIASPSSSSDSSSQGTSQGSSAQPASRPGRRRRQQSKELSAEQMASRKLQGRYLALVRQIPATRRGQYSKIAKESGREAAIQRMEEALRK
jgi:hypothetical protein